MKTIFKFSSFFLVLLTLNLSGQTNSDCDKAIDMMNKNKMDSCDYYLTKSRYYNSSGYVDDNSNCFIPFNTAKEKKYLIDIDKNPTDTNAIASVAVAAYWLKKYDISAKYYNSAIALDPKTKWYYTNLSYLYSNKLANKEKANEVDELFLKNNPSSDNFTDAGAKYFDNKEYSKAIKYFKMALVGTAIDHKALNNIGISFYKDGNIDSAIFYSRKAEALNKDYYAAWVNLYECFYEKGDVKNFVECYGQAFRLRESETYTKKFGDYDCYDVKHDYDAMKEIVENPTAKSYYELGDVYFNRKEYRKSKGIYEQCLKIDPNFGKAHFQLGLINLEYSEKPNYDLAIKYFAKAAPSLSANTMEQKSAYENLGLAYEGKKDYVNALVNYKKGATLEPNYAGSIYCKMSRVYEAQKDTQNAAKYKRYCN